MMPIDAQYRKHHVPTWSGPTAQFGVAPCNVITVMSVDFFKEGVPSGKLDWATIERY